MVYGVLRNPRIDEMVKLRGEKSTHTFSPSGWRWRADESSCHQAANRSRGRQRSSAPHWWPYRGTSILRHCSLCLWGRTAAGHTAKFSRSGPGLPGPPERHGRPCFPPSPFSRPGTPSGAARTSRQEGVPPPPLCRPCSRYCKHRHPPMIRLSRARILAGKGIWRDRGGGDDSPAPRSCSSGEPNQCSHARLVTPVWSGWKPESWDEDTREGEQ